MLRPALALGLTVAAACGGGGSRSTTTTPPPPAAPPPDAAPAPPPPTGAGPAEGPVTDAECAQLVDHVIDLELTASGRKHPGETLSDDVIAQLRASLGKELQVACMQMTRAQYLCGMAAPSVPALEVCDQAASGEAPALPAP